MNAMRTTKTIRIPTDTYDRIREKAEKLNVPIVNLAAALIEHALNEGEKEALTETGSPKHPEQQAHDPRIDFLMATVYEHLWSIAYILSAIISFCPAIKAQAAPRFEEWIKRLDEDNKAGFGFSVLESDEDATK